MKVLIDLDGVVADFVAGAMQLHNKPWPFDEHRGPEAYGIDRAWNIPPAAFWSLMGRDFWANLPLHAEADELMHLLIDRYGLESLCFLTSPCRTAGCVEGKIDWVRKYYRTIPVLFSSSSYRVPSTSPKQFLAHIESLLIDDYDVNVKAFREAGGHAILFPRPWNSAEHLADCDEVLFHIEEQLP